MPRLAQSDEIVRQSVLALSSFHEHYLNSNPDDLSRLKLAENYFQRVQQQIIAMEAPDRHFDSILCACIIFSACEGLRGNFTEATKHALAGMKMIAGQVTNVVRHDYVFRNGDEDLFHVFLDLQAQVMEANEDDFQIDCPMLMDQIGSVPDRFVEFGDALSHLQLLSTQFLQLCLSAEEYHKTNVWIASQIAPALQPAYEEFRQRYTAWAKAVSLMEKPKPEGNDRQYAGHVLLEIYARSFEIDQYVFIHGEGSYDDLKETNLAILQLSAVYIELRHHTKAPSTAVSKRKHPPISFSSSPEIVPLLFEIATRTTVPELNERAISLLRSSNWREGVWDSRSAANLAEKIVDLKCEGALQAAANHHVDCKFLISDILPLSDRKCLVYSGFKKIQHGSFNSFWLETIEPDQGILQSCILDIG